MHSATTGISHRRTRLRTKKINKQNIHRLQRSYLTGWATDVLFCVAGTGVRLEAPLIGKYTTHAAHFPSRCPTRSIG